MAALRFQTVLGHQTSTASHRGWGGGGDRDTQTHGMLDRRANRKRTTERRNSKRDKPRNYRSGQTERGQQKGGTTKDAKPRNYKSGQTKRGQQKGKQKKMRAEEGDGGPERKSTTQKRNSERCEPSSYSGGGGGGGGGQTERGQQKRKTAKDVS